MKNCYEMVNSLFERREQYITEQKEKRRVMTRIAASVCCVCLVALLGFGMWQEGESPNNPAANNKIIVHQIDGLSATKMNICLLGDDFVEMNKAEVNEYYGINVFPTIPDDIKEWEDQHFGIYKRNGGTGEVYWDGMVLNYSNEDFSRAVNIEVQKNALPVCDYGFLEATEEKSIINNAEVAIGESENGYCYAQFLYHNVGFQVIGEGLTQDEFVAVIASLIK